MKINFSKLLLFILVLVLPALGQTSETIHHSSGTHPILFEVIENGENTKKRVFLEFDAWKEEKTSWAQCRIAIIWIIDDGNSIEPYMYYASTDQATIRDLAISSKAISFEMIPFPLAPDHPLRFVAVRKGESSLFYEARVVSLRKGFFDETKLVNTEWKQVTSITLPHSTIKY